MGTNYYWRDPKLKGFYEDDFDGVHVGKSSMGWSFCFRAWPGVFADSDPFGVPVVSREAWAEVFAARVRPKPFSFRRLLSRNTGGRLFDEYGREVADPVRWVSELIPPTPEQLKWERAQASPYMTADRALLHHRDLEGFEFCEETFC